MHHCLSAWKRIYVTVAGNTHDHQIAAKLVVLIKEDVAAISLTKPPGNR
jgi:hypothetical protein